MEKIYQMLAGIAALLVILIGFLTNDHSAEAKKLIPNATTTPYIRTAKQIDLAQMFGTAEGGACYKLADNDGDGFTFLIANNGTISGSLTCD